jgi:predicted Rossmann fold flavoprotein
VEADTDFDLEKLLSDFGTDGFGIRLSEELGCGSAPQYPCLVSLQCAKAQVAGLSGIRAKADAALYDGSRLIHKESGEIQFTDYGLSGIAVMQLSGYLSPDSGIRKPEIRLDLFPHLSLEELASLLRDHGRALPTGSVGDFMTGLIHRKLGLAVWKAAGLGDGNRAVSSLKPEEWSALAHTFQNWSFTALENTGWKNAQTTGGGIALGQLEADTFMRKDAPGLYIVGESTDCAGSCGGFNLHWAFGSGILAGQAAARQLGGKGEPVRRQSAKPAARTPKSTPSGKPTPPEKSFTRKPDKRSASAPRHQGTFSRSAHGGKSNPKAGGKAAPKSSRSRKGR